MSKVPNLSFTEITKHGESYVVGWRDIDTGNKYHVWVKPDLDVAKVETIYKKSVQSNGKPTVRQLPVAAAHWQRMLRETFEYIRQQNLIVAADDADKDNLAAARAKAMALGDERLAIHIKQYAARFLTEDEAKRFNDYDTVAVLRILKYAILEEVK